MKFLLLASVVLLPALALAQTKPHPRPAAPKTTAAPRPATTSKPAPAVAETDAPAVAAAPIPLAPVTPPADPNALKINAQYNPINRSLAVRCDAPGPTAIEINDSAGRPVITKNVIVGSNPTTFAVAALPAGPYVVRCTAGVKQGMRRVWLGSN